MVLPARRGRLHPPSSGPTRSCRGRTGASVARGSLAAGRHRTAPPSRRVGHGARRPWGRGCMRTDEDRVPATTPRRSWPGPSGGGGSGWPDVGRRTELDRARSEARWKRRSSDRCSKIEHRTQDRPCRSPGSPRYQARQVGHESHIDLREARLSRLPATSGAGPPSCHSLPCPGFLEYLLPLPAVFNF